MPNRGNDPDQALPWPMSRSNFDVHGLSAPAAWSSSRVQHFAVSATELLPPKAVGTAMDAFEGPK